MVELGHGSHPVFEIGIEGVLRLAGLEVEKAQDQRAGKAEQGGREGGAHAAQRRGETFLEVGKERACIRRGHIERVDDAGDRAHGFQQAVEGAHQAQEHQQAGQVARSVLGFVEPVTDRIKDGAHGRGRDDGLADPLAQNAGHRRQQDRRTGGGGRSVLQGIDPFDLRKQPENLTEAEEDAHEQGKEDHRIDERICPEKGDDIGDEDGGDQAHQNQKDDDLDQINGRAGEVIGIVSLRHLCRTLPLIRANQPPPRLEAGERRDNGKG